jgi:hypothetical protein
MNDLQEHASPDPPFQTVPMPQNAREAHFLLIILIIMWTLGFGWVLRRGRKNK